MPSKKKAVPLAKRDYSAAEAKWRKREKTANRVENVAGGTATAAGAVMGGAALRDAAFKDHPKFQRRMQARSMDLPRPVAEALMRRKGGLKTMGVAAVSTLTAAGAAKAKYGANKKADQYERMSRTDVVKMARPLDEPGSLMHQADIAKGMIRPEPTDPSIKQHKKVQSALGTTAAVTGLTAAGMKGGGKLLPKILRNVGGMGGKAGAYQKHLDQAADGLLYGGAAIGGTSGIHQSQILGAESKQRKKPVPAGMAKAFDPERSRQRRLKGYEAGGAAATAGLAGAAGVQVGRRQTAKKKVVNLKAAAEPAFKQADRLHDMADAFAGKAEPGETRKRPNYRMRRLADEYRGKAHEAHKMGNSFHAKAGAVKIPSGKTAVKLAAGAAVTGAATVAAHKHRTGGGQAHTGWSPAATKPKAPARNAPMRGKEFGPGEQSRLLPNATEQTAKLAEMAARKKASRATGGLVGKSMSTKKKVAIGAGGTAAAVGAAEVALRVKPLRTATKLATEGEKAYHSTVSGLKPGVHHMDSSVEGLVPHFRGTGRRINNKKHIGDVAHKIQTNGWQKDKRVTVKVYDDGVRIKDGMHRLHAARSLKMDKVPTTVIRESGKAPTKGGIAAAADEMSRRHMVRRIQRGKAKTVPVAPHKAAPFEAGFNTWRSVKGEQAAARSVRRSGAKT